MKALFISLFVILMGIVGCSSTKNTMQDGKMQIIKAEYKKWTKPPLQHSTVPERGTDLFVWISHWPQGAEPVSIIYHNRRSSKPGFAGGSDEQTLIRGRLVDQSSVLVNMRKKTQLSDRLVYATAKGDTSYIEIEEWHKIER